MARNQNALPAQPQKFSSSLPGEHLFHLRTGGCIAFKACPSYNGSALVDHGDPFHGGGADVARPALDGVKSVCRGQDTGELLIIDWDCDGNDRNVLWAYGI